MTTIHTYPQGVFGTKSHHEDVTKKELDWIEIEKRRLIIVHGVGTVILALGMLVGAYFLLW
ncbi:MAG: hypothetical protein PH343_04200 [Nitrospira sp.]|nr:hypothetical protein [Nitrospira sp.]